jgi:hypothetical protein
MIVLGAIAFTLIALVILAVFMSEYSKEATRKAEERDKLKRQVQDAMERKDLPALKRIRLMNSSTLEEIDKGLGQRIETYADELYIEQDDAKAAKVR